MQRRHISTLAAVLIAWAWLALEAPAGEPDGAIRPRDVTWFAIGDPHLGD